MQYFARAASDRGVKELILPLYYVDIPALNDDIVKDDLIELIRTFQWEDWRELRFSDVTSEEYRRGVFRLAKHLAEANRQAETIQPIISTREEGSHDESINELPGIIDLLASGEEGLKEAPKTLSEVTNEIKQIVWSLSNKFATQIYTIDEWVRIIVKRAPEEILENPKSIEGFCNIFASIREMSSASSQAIEAATKMDSSLETLAGMSKDLRPVLRHLRQGLVIIIDGYGISKEWVDLINSTGVECQGSNA